jgi:hypothetical protein
MRTKDGSSQHGTSKWSVGSLERWPTPSQELLLRAALLDGSEARDAWEAWLAGNNVKEPGSGAFALFPLLYTNLNRLDVGGQAVDELGEVYRRTWMRNQRLLRGVLTVLASFEQAGIPAIVLKGAPLLWFYYQDLGQRMMGDVDLLIDEDNLAGAASALEDTGWRFTMPLPGPDFAPFLHAVPCAHPLFGELDLHWRPLLVDSPRDAEGELRRRAVQRVVGKVTVLVPSASDLLLLVLAHGRKPDGKSVCRLVTDAVTIIRTAKPSIDWNALLERAGALDVLLPVRDVLTYVRNTFGGIVPTEFLEQAWSVEATRKDRWRYDQLMHESIIDRRLDRVLMTHWWRYSSGCRAYGRRLTPVGFVRYVATWYQRVFGLGAHRHVPLRLTAALARYIRTSLRERSVIARGGGRSEPKVLG